MTACFTLEQARQAAADARALGELIGVPYNTWSGKCHEISCLLLASGRFGPGRVARGWATGVAGQHSWLVLGPDVYDPQAVIVDPTLTPYLHEHNLVGTSIPGGLPVIQVEYAQDLSHRPHGAGAIWAAPKPPEPTGPVIKLTPSFELSDEARLFLSDEMLGPLDRTGWSQLANGAMELWPAGEIIAAMDDTPELRALVPIDILGMLTSRNPGGAYLAEDLELRP